MKRRRVVKLFSLSMAGILAASSCNVAGSIVNAEEAAVQEEKTQEDVVKEEGNVEKNEEEESNAASSSENEGENENIEIEEEETPKEETSKEETEESSEQDSEEKSSEEETTEEKITEENKAVAIFRTVSEDVKLTQCSGKELKFDSSSTWSEQGETNLGISKETALNSGAKVSFDLYIPEDAADYHGVIKVQGAARLGSDWTWTENKSIPEFTAAQLTQTVEIDGQLYRKMNISYTFGEEVTKDYLADFTIKLAGWMCNYEGSIYYGNVQLTDGEKTDAPADDFTVPEGYHAFYGEDVKFDAASDWDDKGEHQLGLSSDKTLNSGAKVSFDIMIPAEASYHGAIKLQGIARLGEGWSWTQNSVIPEFTSDDFTDTIEIEGVSYKKAKVCFTFGEEITADYLAEFTVKLAGWQCDYEGPVYYTNVKLENGAGEAESKVLQLWDFETGIDGWYYDGTWDNDGENSIEWNEQYQALQMNVDYSKNAASTWSEIKASFWGDDFKASGANRLTFDFIYDAAKLTKGMFKTKIFSNSGVNTDVTINLENAQDYEGTLKKVPVSFTFDQKDIINGITIGIIGYETDYQGAVYIDNVAISSEAAETEDIYVDAAEEVTGQSMQLSVQGNTLVTGAGSSAIAQNITLADADATDEVKQVYAYLQAVGQTDSVIFGQQNNTSHKAGNSDLSCSDTMDVVGSYAGVIGIDGLSLTGDEYSAERYINEMAELDSRYAAVTAKIQAAATTAEKNVIAAAALTNYNIRNGAIATLSIHTPNLSKVNTQNAPEGAPSYASYDFSGYTPGDLSGDVMNNILPGGKYNAQFNAYLDMIADYANQVDGAVLFRPFHENTGSWFWWGAALCDAQTYKSVYKYTVEYLRDEKDVHNLLYVYGPGSEASSVEEYSLRYPGDGYVDMVGFDMYHDNPAEGDSFITSFTKELAVVEDFAKEHGKLVSVTETGARHDVAQGDNQTALLKQGNARKDWHQEILDAVKSSDASYYLVWANFSEKDGFYTPYVKSVKEDGTKHGHEMMDNFIRFFNQNTSVFAVNQKSVLEQMSALTINVKPALTQDGYIVAPIVGTRILEAATLTAKLSGVTEQDTVEFVCAGAAQTRTLTAVVANGYATAPLTADDLAAMGEYVGSITLQINGAAVQTISVMFNIPEPEADPYEIDGFENYYGVDSQLTKAWTTNKASGSSITLSLDEDKVNEGGYAMKFAYNETSDGWAGATITKEVSWEDCDALSFWTIPDGNAQKTVIQITANGNVYEYYMNLNEDYVAAGTNAVYVTIPFSEFVARDIAGNPAGGLAEDKGSISSFGLWVNAIGDSAAVVDGMVSGTIYYDSITAVTAGLDTAKVVLAEETKPQEPSKPQEPDKSEKKSAKKNDSEEKVTADTRVFPTFVGADGVKVSGWDKVVTAAYELTELTSQQVALAGTPDEAANRLAVNINASDVTELVIPAKTVQKMAATGADYNIFMGDTVITLTSRILEGVEGSLDLKLYAKYVKDFGAGFDAMFLSSRTRLKLAMPASINVVVGQDKAGKTAYIYTLSETTKTYELLTAQVVSEIGTICIPVEEYISCLILY